MKKTLLTILQYLVFLGLGIWIVYHMIHQLSPKQESELVDAIKSINPWYLIPIFIVGFLSHFFRGLRWRYLLETVGSKPSVTNITFAVMIGYITNLVLPRAGEVAKCTVLAKYEKVPAHKMIATIVSERAFDIFCLLIIAVMTFVLQASVISGYVSEKMHLLTEKIQRHQNILIAGITFVVLVILFLVYLYRRNKETKVGQIIKEMSHGVLSIFHMKNRWQFMGYTVLIWLMYLGQIYIGLKSLPATQHLNPLSALVVLVYGSVGMIITPGGIGAYPAMVAQVLGVYMIADIPSQAFGWIAWSVQTVIIIILGLISLLLIHPYNRKKDAQATVDSEQDL